MPATVTLSSTSLAAPVAAGDTVISVGSTSGLAAGTRLFCEGELMSVISLGVDPWVNVQRGVDGTSASDHDSSAVIYVGRADQFYSADPVGSPSESIPVSPYINAMNGSIWYAQGDSLPAGRVYRWWQKVSTTYGQGALGVRTSTADPSSST